MYSCSIWLGKISLSLQNWVFVTGYTLWNDFSILYFVSWFPWLISRAEKTESQYMHPILQCLNPYQHWSHSHLQKMEFSIKIFFKKCDQIVNGKLHFLRCVNTFWKHEKTRHFLISSGVKERGKRYEIG